MNNKPGRNQPCPCGSGLKYKKCCISRESTSMRSREPVDQAIAQAATSILSPNASLVAAAIDSLQGLRARTDLTTLQRINVVLTLGKGLQQQGRHQDALEVLRTLPNLGDELPVHAGGLYLYGISLCALGYVDAAAECLEDALHQAGPQHVDLSAGIKLELGQVYYRKKDYDRAGHLWSEALAHFESVKDADHIARSRANLALIDLHDPSPEKQQAAVQIIEQSSMQKLAMGDLSGLATNYCNLSLYYKKQRRFERALAYARKDLSLSQKIGDQKGIAVSLLNLGGLYTDLRQPSEARSVTSQAKALGEALKDDAIVLCAEHNSRVINALAREAGLAGKGLGSKAPCECESGEIYKDCCGRADFAPVDLFTEVGILKDVERIHEENTARGIDRSHLDFIFRDGDDVEQRRGWGQVRVRDGWLEYSELPDAVNLHLLAARGIAAEAQVNPEDTAKPMAALILSVCAIEAFLNQAAFFLHHVQSFPEKALHPLPVEMSGDPVEFQRQTNMADKWAILGRALCGASWPPPANLVDDFTRLVELRNELVHFKTASYHQIVPPPKDVHPMIRRLPASVAARETLASWPGRVLTPELATWAVESASGVLRYFRRAFRDARLAQGTQ